MNMGAQRHVGDIKVAEICEESQKVLPLQSGDLNIFFLCDAFQ